MASEEEVVLMLLLRRRQRKNRSSSRRRWYLRPLNESRLENGEYVSLIMPMRELDSQRHHQYFRMDVSRFDNLLRRVAPFISHARTHSQPVGESERLAITLRHLSTGLSHQALAASFKLGANTVGLIVSEVCQAIWCALKEFVAFPDAAEWEKIRGDFWHLWRFPNCVGAVDGKHIRVCCPANSGSSFYNYKGYFSFILMAACDARYKFTFVDIGAYGRDSDAGVFARSSLGSQLMQGQLPLPPPAPLPGSQVTTPLFFVGDEAFPQKVNLMRPYPGLDFTPEERIYNYRHSRARRVIENSFGILAARWRVFRTAMECSVDKAQDITKACVCLHNFLCASDHVQPEQSRYITRNMADADDTPGEWRQIVRTDDNLQPAGRLSAARATQRGMAVREQLKEYFQTAGRLPYQDEVLLRGTLRAGQIQGGDI